MRIQLVVRLDAASRYSSLCCNDEEKRETKRFLESRLFPAFVRARLRFFPAENRLGNDSQRYSSFAICHTNQLKSREWRWHSSRKYVETSRGSFPSPIDFRIDFLIFIHVTYKRISYLCHVRKFLEGHLHTDIWFSPHIYLTNSSRTDFDARPDDQMYELAMFGTFERLPRAIKFQCTIWYRRDCEKPLTGKCFNVRQSNGAKKIVSRVCANAQVLFNCNLADKYYVQYGIAEQFPAYKFTPWVDRKWCRLTTSRCLVTNWSNHRNTFHDCDVRVHR